MYDGAQVFVVLEVVVTGIGGTLHRLILAPAPDGLDGNNPHLVVVDGRVTEMLLDRDVELVDVGRVVVLVAVLGRTVVTVFVVPGCVVRVALLDAAVPLVVRVEDDEVDDGLVDVVVGRVDVVVERVDVVDGRVDVVVVALVEVDDVLVGLVDVVEVGLEDVDEVVLDVLDATEEVVADLVDDVLVDVLLVAVDVGLVDVVDAGRVVDVEVARVDVEAGLEVLVVLDDVLEEEAGRLVVVVVVLNVVLVVDTNPTLVLPRPSARVKTLVLLVVARVEEVTDLLPRARPRVTGLAVVDRARSSSC